MSLPLAASSVNFSKFQTPDSLYQNAPAEMLRAAGSLARSDASDAAVKAGIEDLQTKFVEYTGAQGWTLSANAANGAGTLLTATLAVLYYFGKALPGESDRSAAVRNLLADTEPTIASLGQALVGVQSLFS